MGGCLQTVAFVLRQFGCKGVELQGGIHTSQLTRPRGILEMNVAHTGDAE